MTNADRITPKLCSEDIELLAEQLHHPRHPEKIRYTAVELLRERIYALALGSKNQDDLDRLAHDPAMRMAV